MKKIKSTRKKSPLRDLSKTSRDLLTALISSAEILGSLEDQGLESSSESKAFKKNQAKLAARIAYLEKKVESESVGAGSETKPVWYLKVASSNIAKAAYNFKSHQLMIAFRNGRRYVYEDVSLDEWLAFSEADSQGQWFTSNIRDIKPCTRLD